MENLLFSLNTVLPVFVLGGLGYILVQQKIITEKWAETAASACFKVFLPIMLFNEVYHSSILETFDVGYVLFGVGGIVFTAAASCIIWPLFVKDRARCGAVAHSTFRSNFILLGIPVLTNMYGVGGTTAATSLLPFAVTTFNICAVLCFTIFEPVTSGEKRKFDVMKVFLGVVKNPLIIGTALGAVVLALGWQLPPFLEKGVSNIASMASPLVLLSVGAQFNFATAKRNLKTSVGVSLVRLVLVPAAMVTLAYFWGFRGAELATLYVLYGSPTATSGAAMANNMGSDGALTGEITLISALLSAVTFFLGVLLLKTTGLV